MSQSKIPITRGGILHTDIWISHVPDNQDLNRNLITSILNHQKNNPQIDSMANPGCWRGSSDFKGIETIIDNAIGMLKSIHMHYIHTGAPCTNIANFSKEKFSVDYWANINAPGSTNAIHSHSKWHWSGVYYAQGKSTGDIAFYSNQYLNQQTSIGLPFGQSFTVSPEDGMLIIFPSYLFHEVLRNESDKDRINIAFNIKIDFNP